MKKKFLLAFISAAMAISPVTAFASTAQKNENCRTYSFDSFAYNYLISSGLINEDCLCFDEYLSKLVQESDTDNCWEIILNILNSCGGDTHFPGEKPDESPDDTPDEKPDAPEDPDVPEEPDVTVIPDTPGEPDDGTHHNDEETPQGSEYAEEVVRLVNIERAKAGLSALETDYTVQKAAQIRAQETELSFSHTRPDGRSCYTALDEVGAVYSGAAENIAYGQRSPEEVMEAWMNSDGHRKNILNPNYTHIGVGCYESGGIYYWSQFFTY